MADINALSRALSRGSEAEGQLAGLDEQYEQARKGQTARVTQDRYGQVSPLSVLADVMRQSNSRRNMRELEPQRDAARQTVAENENALPMYQAQASAAKAVQDQTNFETTTGLNKAKTAETVRHNRSNSAFKQAQLKQKADEAGETVRHNRSNSAFKQAQLKQKADEAGETVEMVDMTDPKNRLMVGKKGDQYFDVNTGKPFDPTGYTEKVKNTRSSGSRYTRSKSEDPHGNDVITVFDKSTGGERIASFGDGTPYSEEVAADKGSQRAAQKGKEKYATEDVKIDLAAAETAHEKISALGALQREMKKGLEAYDEGAETGPIAQLFPNMRASTIKLANVVDNMALSDIGNYSFGALSEAEGDWLRAANLPMNLNEDEGRAWLSKRYEATSRLIRSTTYEQDMRAAQHKPDRAVINQILYAGGFKYEG